MHKICRLYGDRVSHTPPVGTGPPWWDPLLQSPHHLLLPLNSVTLESKVKVRWEHLKMSVKLINFRMLRCGNDTELDCIYFSETRIKFPI